VLGDENRHVIGGADNQGPSAHPTAEGGEAVDELVGSVAVMRPPEDVSRDIPRQGGGCAAVRNHRVDRDSCSPETPEDTDAAMQERELRHPQHHGREPSIQLHVGARATINAWYRVDESSQPRRGRIPRAGGRTHAAVGATCRRRPLTTRATAEAAYQCTRLRIARL
jgi:hypothetical protein